MVDGLDFSTIDENEKLLEREFDRKLIQALKELRGDEALGPDGFSVSLWSSFKFQHCWQVVKANIMAFFKEFHESYKFGSP